MAVMDKIQLAPNVPARMTIRYVDVYPNDTTKNNGQGYGASVRLKGTAADGGEAVCYPKGKAWAVLKALVAGGVVAPGEYDDDPEKSYSIGVVNGDAELVLEQKPGEKYANFKATAAGALAPPAPAPVRAGTKESHKEPHSEGGPLPYEVPADAAGTPTAPDFAALVDRYEECFGVALSQANVAKQRGLPLTGEAIAAVAATLFIERNRRGI